MSERQADVLVLGGGVIGLACALHLLRAGRSVVLLERDRVAAATSHGNCGTITPSHAAPLAMPGMVGQALRWMLRPDAPFHVALRLDPALFGWLLKFARRCRNDVFERTLAVKAPLLRLSRQVIEALIHREGLDCGFETLGTLNVYRDAHGFEKSMELARMLDAHGLPVRTLDAAACRQMEPMLRSDIAGGHFNPGDAHLRPERYGAELARVVRALGGHIHEGTPVTGFRTESGRIVEVETANGAFRGHDVVLALGSWSPLLARRLGLRIPIQPGKGYSITYTRPARCPRIPMTFKERAVCVTAWQDGYRLGSTMEFSGYDTTLNRTRLTALKRGAAEYLDLPEGLREVERWYGWRPMTHDDLPILGRSAKLQNLVLASGHGMLGVTMSAATGLLVSELIAQRPPSLDPAPFAPNRFNL